MRMEGRKNRWVRKRTSQMSQREPGPYRRWAALSLCPGLGASCPSTQGTLSGGHSLSEPAVDTWSLNSSHLGCQRPPCAFLSLASLASDGRAEPCDSNSLPSRCGTTLHNWLSVDSAQILPLWP